MANRTKRLHRKSLAPVKSGVGFLITVFLFGLVFSFCLGVSRVHGDGMQPAIHDGGLVLTDTVAYRLRSPSRGDVVLASGHVLRVVGLPGETITIQGGEVFLEGILLQETYLSASMRTWPVADNDTFILGDDEYFLLSDERGCYDDSRSGRLYQRSEILAKVIFGT